MATTRDINKWVTWEEKRVLPDIDPSIACVFQELIPLDEQDNRKVLTGFLNRISTFIT
jgi:hypothetical protein